MHAPLWLYHHLVKKNDPIFNSDACSIPYTFFYKKTLSSWSSIFLTFHEFAAEIFLTFAEINYLHFTIYIVLHGSSIMLWWNADIFVPMTIKEKSRSLYESLQKWASVNFWHVKKMKCDFLSIFLNLSHVIFLGFSYDSGQFSPRFLINFFLIKNVYSN